ncbi:MAG: RNase H-like domain-containing protein, partial [Bacteroidota bacterium]
MGFSISKEGIRPGKKNVEKIVNLIISTVKDVRSFVGMCNFFRRFIENFAQHARPLVEMTVKNYHFTKVLTPEQQAAIKYLKDKLSTFPILRHPDFARRFFLRTDGSKQGIGVVLEQKISEDRNQRYVIGYASHPFKEKDMLQPPWYREVAAASYGMNYFRHYLLGREFTLCTDNEMIKYLFSKKARQRLRKYIVETQEFTFTVEHIPGRLHFGADLLSRAGVKEGECDQKTKDYQKSKYLHLQRTYDEEADDSPSEDAELDDSDESPYKLSGETPITTPLGETKFSPFPPVLSHQCWLESQQKDAKLRGVREILEDPTQQRDDIRRVYSIQDNLICYKPPNSSLPPRVVVTKTMRYKITHNVHLHLGHPSKATQEYLMERRFYWRKMRTYIKRYCSGCATCQRRLRKPP